MIRLSLQLQNNSLFLSFLTKNIHHYEKQNSDRIDNPDAGSYHFFLRFAEVRLPKQSTGKLKI